jgi:hypothetical protein
VVDALAPSRVGAVPIVSFTRAMEDDGGQPARQAMHSFHRGLPLAMLPSK